MTGPKRAILIGHPLGHSLSPAFQNAAFRAAGIDAEYSLADVLPEHLAATVASLRADDMLGANVTVPYKQAVIPFLDESERRCARPRRGQYDRQPRRAHLYGLNTDVPGFAADLREHGIDVAGTVRRDARRGRRGTGRGGGARRHGRRTTDDREPHAGARRSYRRPLSAYRRGDRAWTSDEMPGALAEASLLVNATSVGLHGDDMPIPHELLIAPVAADAVVYDLIYRPTALAPRRRSARPARHRRPRYARPSRRTRVGAMDGAARTARCDVGGARRSSTAATVVASFSLPPTIRHG